MTKVNYKKADRVIVNLGTKKEVAYFLGTISAKIKANADRPLFRILFDDGDKDTVKHTKIVGLGINRPFKNMIDPEKLEKFLVKEVAKPAKKVDAKINKVDAKKMGKLTKPLEEKPVKAAKKVQVELPLKAEKKPAKKESPKKSVKVVEEPKKNVKKVKVEKPSNVIPMKKPAKKVEESTPAENREKAKAYAKAKGRS